MSSDSQQTSSIRINEVRHSTESYNKKWLFYNPWIRRSLPVTYQCNTSNYETLLTKQHYKWNNKIKILFQWPTGATSNQYIQNHNESNKVQNISEPTEKWNAICSTCEWLTAPRLQTKNHSKLLGKNKKVNTANNRSFLSFSNYQIAKRWHHDFNGIPLCKTYADVSILLPSKSSISQQCIYETVFTRLQPRQHQMHQHSNVLW